MRKFGGGFVLAVFGLFWCGLTFLADGVFLWNAARQLATTRYTTTSGVITHSAVETDSDGEGTSYKPDVKYRYEVGGETFEAKRIRYDQSGFGKDRTYAQVAKYPVGRTVTVYYHPSSPQDSVLELGLDFANMFGFLFLSPFNAVAFGFVGGFIGWLRAKRLGRPIAGVAVRDDGLTTTLRMYDFSPAVAALVGWGGAGFLATFGVLLLSWAIGLESAIVLGWSATIAATIVAWRHALKKRTEIRRDVITGRVELSQSDGSLIAIAPQDLRGVRYSEISTTDSDGDRVQRFPLRFAFFDQDQQREMSVTLPEQTTEEAAAKFAAWLNNLLGLKNLGKEESPFDDFDDDFDDEDEDDEDETTTIKA